MTSTREPALLGQTVVAIGGSGGIGLETARLARAEGAEVVVTGRNAERTAAAAEAVGARDTAVFDANDPDAIAAFFANYAPGSIDHIMLTAGAPTYQPFFELSGDEARSALSDHLLQATQVARGAVGTVRPGGSLTFMGGTGGRKPSTGIAVAAETAALGPLAAALALELAPVRVNQIAAGFVDTALSARFLGDQLDARREWLATHLPIRRVVGPADVAALALHLMSNTALTGATFDIDGGQQLL